MALNLGLVRKEAHYWTSQCQETYDDLLQVGSIGLIVAIDKFEVAKGYAFSTFAVPYIRGEIQHYLRDKSSVLKIPRRWFALFQQAGTTRKNFQVQHQRQPTEAEIALVVGGLNKPTILNSTSDDDNQIAILWLFAPPSTSTRYSPAGVARNQNGVPKPPAS